MFIWFGLVLFFNSQPNLIAPKSLGARQCAKVEYFPLIFLSVWQFLALKASPRDLGVDFQRQRIPHTCECTEHYLVSWGILLYFFFSKCFSQILSGEQKNEELTTAMLHKIEYPLFLLLS